MFLDQLNIHYEDRWQNIGLLFVYIAFNIAAAIGLYWLLRVPKKSLFKKKAKKE
jgi:ABC-type multidrug transport system permease subunit